MSWTCNECTQVNQISDQSCKVCEEPKPLLLESKPFESDQIHKPTKQINVITQPKLSQPIFSQDLS